MVAGAIAGNISAEATTPTGNISAEAMRGQSCMQSIRPSGVRMFITRFML